MATNEQKDDLYEDPDGIYVDDEAEAEKAKESAAAASGLDPVLLKILESQAATNARVAQALETISAQKEAGPIPQIPLTAKKIRTPWNPSGERYKVKLERATFMNGNKLREIMLSPSEVSKLNQLQPGDYRGGKFRVLQGSMSAGDGVTKPAIYLIVPNKTMEQRMENMQLFRNLEELLDLLIAEKGPAPTVLAS